MPGIGKWSRSTVDLIGVKHTHTAELERKRPLILPPPCCSRKDLTLQFSVQRQYFQTVSWMPEFAIILLELLCMRVGSRSQRFRGSGCPPPFLKLRAALHSPVYPFEKRFPSAFDFLSFGKEIQGTGGRVLRLGGHYLQSGKHGGHRRGDRVPSSSALLPVPQREAQGHQENEPQGYHENVKVASYSPCRCAWDPWTIVADTYKGGQQEGLESGDTVSRLPWSDKEWLQEETQSGKGLKLTGVLRTKDPWIRNDSGWRNHFTSVRGLGERYRSSPLLWFIHFWLLEHMHALACARPLWGCKFSLLEIEKVVNLLPLRGTVMDREGTWLSVYMCYWSV